MEAPGKMHSRGFLLKGLRLCTILAHRFHDDLPPIDVPTLIIHGDADRILALKVHRSKTLKLIKKKNSQLVVIPVGLTLPTST